MRGGCFGFLFNISTYVVSAALITIGSILLVIGLLTSSPASGATTTLSLVAALVAAYLFVRVGREIWRDLRNPKVPNKRKESVRRDSGGDE
ncbi:hypothetical protein BH24ACT22_BH24ACT22_10390 [soil metagenome]